VVLTIVVLAALALAGRLYGRFGDTGYQPSVTRLEQPSDTSVTVVFTTGTRDGRPSVCRVKAKDRSGAEVGYAEVPAGSAAPVRYTLATTRRADAVEILGCRPA
jgi:hypothetical protein